MCTRIDVIGDDGVNDTIGTVVLDDGMAMNVCNEWNDDGDEGGGARMWED